MSVRRASCQAWSLQHEDQRCLHFLCPISGLFRARFSTSGSLTRVGQRFKNLSELFRMCLVSLLCEPKLNLTGFTQLKTKLNVTNASRTRHKRFFIELQPVAPPCSPLLSRSRLSVGGVGLLTGWWADEYYSCFTLHPAHPSLVAPDLNCFIKMSKKSEQFVSNKMENWSIYLIKGIN